ncbi:MULTISPECIES: sterol desaturase family protein [unclassified Streptomyces]|uniref:sterol desaturase family protein n=1 Tax=unclassified Streptomyces TaxID=2593676 RepID=UPI002E788AC7|nr:sterol desaturase family protein [Streptomyces sp. JV184]MEE1746215.1 sterol desaturase family protein [Streptomyces sp. JV184]
MDSGRARGESAPASSTRAVLCVSAYPFLLASTVLVAAVALWFDWDPDRVSPLFLLGVISYLTALERLIPHRRSWHPNAGEWRWYGVYFVLTMAASAFAQYLVSAVVTVVSPHEPTFNLWVEMPAALLTGSLASYLVHRLGHTNAILWRVHGVHHVPEKVNVANNGVNHVLDIVLAQGTVQLALALVGFSRDSVFVVGLFVAAQGYFVHANIDVRIGRLNHVLASPEQHRLHHSTDLSEAGHYGSDLSIWDHFFGSYTWRPGREPVAVGLGDPASFPPTGEIVSSFLHPLRRAKGPGTGSA